MQTDKEKFNKILQISKIAETDIVCVYPYGSRVYGTHDFNSDFDYITVYRGDDSKNNQQYDSFDKTISTHTYNLEKWREHISNHKIFALECISLIGDYPKFGFNLNLSILRKEISATASNSWVKCKKKIEIENDYNIAIKSIFHSFRIPMFGIQIAKYGKIVDFHEANYMWVDQFKEMVYSEPSWQEIKEKYKPMHNQLMTKFRKFAEK
jgi:predicted nucleotidyltransferase